MSQQPDQAEFERLRATAESLEQQLAEEHKMAAAGQYRARGQQPDRVNPFE